MYWMTDTSKTRLVSGACERAYSKKQQIRHAVVTEGDKLFVTELINEIDAQHSQSLQTKSFMKTTAKAESKNS